MQMVAIDFDSALMATIPANRRCIYAYFMGASEIDVSRRDFLSHHIYELSPGPFGCRCAVINPLDQSSDLLNAPNNA